MLFIDSKMEGWNVLTTTNGFEGYKRGGRWRLDLRRVGVRLASSWGGDRALHRLFHFLPKDKRKVLTIMILPTTASPSLDDVEETLSMGIFICTPGLSRRLTRCQKYKASAICEPRTPPSALILINEDSETPALSRCAIEHEVPSGV